MKSEDGNQYRDWIDQMRLEKIDELTYRSTCAAPGFGHRAFGGHFMAQALWAGSQTVKKGFMVHSFTSYFLIQGICDIPFIYRVRVLREGGGYCTRQVDVFQNEPEQLLCTCICSFKRSEARGLDVQEKCNIRQKYKLALGDKRPEEWPEAPIVDTPWWWEKMAKPGNSRDGNSNLPFPGASRRKVDMGPYNATVEPRDRFQLQYYRIEGAMPPASKEPNLHAAAHIYCSDSNGLFMIPNFLQEDDAANYHKIGSLSHSVVFHGGPEELSWYSEDGKPRWFCQEAWVERFAYGRGLTPSKYWSEDGVHVMSTFQDGMVRLGQDKGKQSSAALFSSYRVGRTPGTLQRSTKL